MSGLENAGRDALAGEERLGQDSVAFASFVQAVSGDFDLLAELHDREPTAAMVEAVQCCPIEDQLGLVLRSDAGLAALAAFKLATEELPRPVTQHAIDELAAAYADVYLRHTYRAAPTESVWLTEDGLERQSPMFEVREFYRRHNLVATDWANRPDDHIVLQLRFMARVFDAAKTPDDLAGAVAFLDAHLLRWAKRHAIRLVQTGAPEWYAAVSLLTACYADEVRDHLSALTGMARPLRVETSAAKNDKAAVEAAMPYIPGVAPSW
ncbi:MAG: molecular chaperone TorD family protein [Hyphomicrobium sp.]